MGVQGKQREMQAAVGPRHAIEKILALVLVTFLVIDGLLVLPAYASEARLDSLEAAVVQTATALAVPSATGPPVATPMPSDSPGSSGTQTQQGSVEADTPVATLPTSPSHTPNLVGTQDQLEPSTTPTNVAADSLETAVVQTAT